MQLKSYREAGNIENQVKATKSDRGQVTYEVKINPDSKDHMARFLICFQCSSYCIETVYGPPADLQISVSQWSNGKLAATDTQDVIVASNLRNKLNPKKKRKLNEEYSADEFEIE